jgi:carbonic anhydrase/acetyltransferase-like protein (isoleucine patch superfamily)
MVFERNGRRPELHPSAVVAASARIVGDVRVGRRCYIGDDVVLEGSDAPISLGSEVAVLAGTVIRAVGTFPVTIGDRTLIGRSSVLTGCRIGGSCCLASGVTVLPGAELGDDALLGVGWVHEPVG